MVISRIFLISCHFKPGEECDLLPHEVNVMVGRKRRALVNVVAGAALVMPIDVVVEVALCELGRVNNKSREGTGQRRRR